jgi:O-antigen ligase
MFLLMASEIGVIGTILYMALPIAVIVSLLRVYRSASQDLQIWLYAGAIGLSAVMIHGLVESNIVARHRIAMMFWMISGLLLGLATQHRQEVEHSKTP